MTKKIILILLTLAALTLSACGGAKTEKMIESGNEAFAQQDYATALSSYQQAAVENPELAEPIYNAANVQYRQGEYEQTNATLQVALANADEGLAAEGYFNLGNAHFQTAQYPEAVDAYTESLRLNPNDMDAKVNLELALQKLQQQEQEQEQQEQEQQNQDEQSQDEQNQDEQNQDEQNQDQQNQDEQSQDEQNQDEQSQDEQSQGEQNQDEQSQDEQSQDEQSQDEQSQDQQDESDQQNGEEEKEQDQPQQPQPGQAGGEPSDEEVDPTEMSLGELLEMDGLTEEQARQLLVAAAQGTETLQEYLQQMYVFPHSDVEQDW